MSALCLDMDLFPRDSGVYAIENRVNGKVYVGSAKNLAARQRRHRSSLRAGTHCNAHLQAAWRLDGEHAFVFRVLELVAVDSLIATEQKYIDYYSPSVRYNILPNARSPIGRTYSAEIRRKMSEGCKRRPPVSAETRALLSSLRRGVKRDPAIGRKVGDSHRGRALSADHRAKLSAAQTGKTLSAETRAKVSAAGIGRRMMPEQIAALIARNTGRVMSVESRAKTAATLRGRKMSSEARARMSASHKKRWAAIRAMVAA